MFETGKHCVRVSKSEEALYTLATWTAITTNVLKGRDAVSAKDADFDFLVMICMTGSLVVMLSVGLFVAAT